MAIFDLFLELQWDLLRIRWWGSHSLWSLSPYLLCVHERACHDSRYKRSKQCYCVLSMVSFLSTLLIWRSKHAMHWMLCLLRLLILLSKYIHTFLPITFLIFNRFSICKKFLKYETEGFSTIPSILYMSIMSIQDKDLLTKLPPQTGEQLNPQDGRLFK